ncbi:hypothetical protein [Ureibacillus sp. FSL K6-0165]
MANKIFTIKVAELYFEQLQKEIQSSGLTVEEWFKQKIEQLQKDARTE